MTNNVTIFVYGIFLGERNRNRYGMTNPRYATVMGYATYPFGTGHIVYAKPLEGACLSGLLVDMPIDRLPDLDALEGGYDRVTVTTTDKTQAYMYQG